MSEALGMEARAACPFCASLGWVVSVPEYANGALLRCEACHASGPLVFREEGERHVEMTDRAIAAWNRRPEVESLRSQLAAANEAKEKAEREYAAVMEWEQAYGGRHGRAAVMTGWRFWAQGKEGRVYADTREAAIRKAAGLEESP